MTAMFHMGGGLLVDVVDTEHLLTATLSSFLRACRRFSFVLFLFSLTRRLVCLRQYFDCFAKRASSEKGTCLFKDLALRETRRCCCGVVCYLRK